MAVFFGLLVEVLSLLDRPLSTEDQKEASEDHRHSCRWLRDGLMAYDLKPVDGRTRGPCSGLSEK